VKFAPSAGRSPGSANCGGSNSQTRNSPSLSLSLSLAQSSSSATNLPPNTTAAATYRPEVPADARSCWIRTPPSLLASLKRAPLWSEATGGDATSVTYKLVGCLLGWF